MQEVKVLKKFSYLLAVLMFFILSLENVMAVITFTTYVLLVGANSSTQCSIRC